MLVGIHCLNQHWRHKNIKMSHISVYHRTCLQTFKISFSNPKVFSLGYSLKMVRVVPGHLKTWHKRTYEFRNVAYIDVGRFLWYSRDGLTKYDVWVENTGEFITWTNAPYFPSSPLNPYPWILGKKNPKRGTITERVSRKKNPERSVASFVYVSVLWIFFPEIALGDGPKNLRIRVKVLINNRLFLPKYAQFISTKYVLPLFNFQ